MRSGFKAASRTNVLDAKKRVVLRDTLAARRCTSLDLADTEGDDEVRDDGVLRLTAAVRDHDTPAIGLRELSTVKKQISRPVSSRHGAVQLTPGSTRRFVFVFGV